MNFEKVKVELIKEIKKKEEELKGIENFYNLNYIEKYKLGVETNLIYQREGFQKELKKSFHSKHMRNGRVEIRVNETVIHLDYGYAVIIPMHSNIIQIKLNENSVLRRGIKFAEKNISKNYKEKKKKCLDNILELENTKKKVSFYKLKEKKLLNKKIIEEEFKLSILKTEKEKINKLKKNLNNSIGEYEINLIDKLLYDDIQFFKENKYKIEIQLYILNKKIIANL